MVLPTRPVTPTVTKMVANTRMPREKGALRVSFCGRISLAGFPSRLLSMTDALGPTLLPLRTKPFNTKTPSDAIAHTAIMAAGLGTSLVDFPAIAGRVCTDPRRVRFLTSERIQSQLTARWSPARNMIPWPQNSWI